MAIILEKDIEKSLGFETQPLEMPDGTCRSFSMMALHWVSLEYVARRHYSIETMLDQALDIADRFSITPDDALAYVANRYHHWLKRITGGGPLESEPGACPLIFKPWDEPPKDTNVAA